nr:MOSC domain-containing protein [Allosediminivita pacifica]
MERLADLQARHAGAGRLEWIGLRPARREPLLAVETADVCDAGLEGDHAGAGRRAVTLIQSEHLPVIAALAKLHDVAPEMLRRNLVVSGLNLIALRNRRIAIGDVVLSITAPCPPCSRMEQALGAGGYTAMRGHGGVYAEVVRVGTLRLGDCVRPDGDEDAG